MCKIAIILALAAFFAKRKDNLKNFKTFFLACAIALVPTMFILVQSDLSSSIVMIVILIMMLANSGIGHKVLGPVAAVMIPVAGFLFWYIQQPGQKLLHGYQLKRIMGWLHPEEQALDTMFQQNNSILSIASGKLYGKMLDGTTTTRNYSKVDVTESDFIWTPIGEEFGFIGCMVILLLLSIIIIKCFIAAKNAKDYTGMMIAVGIGSMVYVGTDMLGVAIIGQAINGLAWGFLEPLQMILIQERADIKYLGRITGFVRFGLMSAGVLPLLAAPFLAEALGVQTVLFGASTIIALVGTLFFVTQGRRQRR